MDIIMPISLVAIIIALCLFGLKKFMLATISITLIIDFWIIIFLIRNWPFNG